MIQLESYTCSATCSYCGRVVRLDVEANIPMSNPSMRFTIDYVDVVSVMESMNMGLINPDHGPDTWICSNCQDRQAERRSYPPIFEHNPSLASNF